MKKVRSGSGVDYSWLQHFDVDGPFLSLPVVKGFWPSGVDRLSDADDRLVTFKQGFATWLRAYDQQSLEKRDQYALTARVWVDTVLDDLAEWDGLRIGAEELPAEFEIHSPGEQVRIRADGGLRGRESGEVAALLWVVTPSEDLRGPGLDGWAATEIDRMAALLRKAGVPIGLVTDGRWWGIVWAEEGTATGSGVVDAVTWGEEPLLRDAFLALINQQRLRAKNPEHRLARLLQRSELEAEEITEALGTQVRKSVELLVQAFSEARLIAVENGEPDPLTEKPDDVYQAAVTVMMRVVFLLFAEERGMLPTERLYWDSYAIHGLLDDLKFRALAHGEENLDESHDVWHRLLAVSDALYFGVNYDEMRMPAYGGSLLDPARFPWLTATDQHGLKVQVSDRVMLHVLESVQEATVRGEARRISFRDIDVEQIGYIYEGLLGYSCANVADDVVVGLVGKEGEEPEIRLGQLNELRESASSTKAFVDKLSDWVKKHQPAASMKTSAQLVKLTDGEVDEAELRRLLTPVVGNDPELLADLIRWGNVIRRDLRGIPLVVPPGGLVVVETPSRRNAGAHYTPRSLAEEVVKYALEPVVYEPGPLQTNDVDAWKLKSSTAILDLKVADIAAGSGAFLVAAARFLAKRVTEAWTEEGMLSQAELVEPLLAEERAIREVVARCLYGADINPMAVEMCKLSLWLVSLDKTKPFSFVDDKILVGNSLLGVTSLDQLRHLHIDPDRKRKFLQPFVDVGAVIAEATRLRRELASPVDEDDPQRSTAGKLRLLRRADEVTAQLKLMADGIIAAGLALGGKPGAQLDDAYRALEWALAEAFPRNGPPGDRRNLDTILGRGLTPTADTDYQRWQPLHWAIEVPDVMERGGFDAVIGNPPFLAGKKIATAYGPNIENWIKSDLEGQKGAADLVAHFIRRAWNLLHDNGSLGLIATDRIGQGDTALMSTQVLTTEGRIYRARSAFRWPGASSTGAAIVWAVKNNLRNPDLFANLDGVDTISISASLTDGSEPDLSSAAPLALPFPAGNGIYLYGEGFVLDGTDPLIGSLSAQEVAALRPFVNGQSQMSGVPSGRFVIDVGKYTDEESLYSDMPVLAEHLRLTVKPIRDAITSQVHEYRYWAFWDKRESLIAATRSIDRFIVLTRDTRVPVFLFSSDHESLLTDQVVLIATGSPSILGVLSSTVHSAWFERTRTGRGTTSRYLVSRCLRTFPFPAVLDSALMTASLEFIAVRDRAREEVVSLTRLYNLVDDPAVDEPRVLDLRNAQRELDQAVCRNYGWHDLSIDHGFFEVADVRRFTCSPLQRSEIRRRLLKENHRQAAEQASAAKPKRKSGRSRSANDKEAELF